MTWQSSDFLDGLCSLTFSSFWGMFVAIDTGQLWISPNAQYWNKHTTTPSIAPVLGENNALAAVGPAIAVLTNRPAAGTFYARGIAYTFDLGATWNESYFGVNKDSTFDLQQLIAASGRLYACDMYNVYVSGELEAPAALYTGV